MTFPILTHTDQGSGQPLVLLHGFPLTRRMWDAEIQAWSPYYRVIAPDLRGFGETPIGEGQFTMEGCAQDVEELLSELGIQQKIVLLGLSMGGYIAFEFIRKYQERLCALALVGTQPVADSEQARAARFETAEFVCREGTAALARRLIPRFLGKTTLENKPQVAEALSELIQYNTPQAIAKACHGLATRRDSTPLLASIQVPTLIVAGAEDALIMPVQAETMNRSIPNSKLIVVEQCGHLINLEQPQRLQNAVSPFLVSLSR